MNIGRIAAVTLTFPDDFVISSLIGCTNGHESAKPLPCEVCNTLLTIFFDTCLPQTAAGLCMSIFQECAWNIDRIAAVTLAFPNDFIIFSLISCANGNKPAKPLPG